ncbi:hypothetical protein MTW91_01695 [Mammaliicoccus sciuri]|uniref:hypothetical protein n=1 Tax=Mammaliicoccus sciuri TaxID=1296 RepID=UPI001FB3AB48|nr:hypothetical protein [Mammaliicoccus sciuri]MCJ0923996.1 hypothetical protein [Mammaliicoccus sciuri]
MGFLFAMCDNCNTIYNTGINITNSSDIKMENNSFGKCDICKIGNVMSVDGLYSEIDNVMSIVAIDEGKDLEKLYNILKGVTEDTSIDEIEGKINEETPQYNGVTKQISNIMKKGYKLFIATSILLGAMSSYKNFYDDFIDKKDEEIEYKKKQAEIDRLQNQAIEKLKKELKDKE